MFSADTTTRLTDARSLIASATSGTYDAAPPVNPSAPAPTSRRNRPSPRETSAPAAWTKCHRCIASSDWHAASRYRRSRLLESDHQSAVASRLLLRPWFAELLSQLLFIQIHSGSAQFEKAGDLGKLFFLDQPGFVHAGANDVTHLMSFGHFRNLALIGLLLSGPQRHWNCRRVARHCLGPVEDHARSSSGFVHRRHATKDCGANGDPRRAHSPWYVDNPDRKRSMDASPSSLSNHCDCCRCIPRWCIASDDRETLWR